MKKKVLALFLAATLLTGLYGCSTANSQSAADTAAATETAAAEEAETTEASAAADTAEETTDTFAAEIVDYTTGSPWMDSNIASNVESVSEADVKDHFELAVNGEWVKTHKIKSGESCSTFMDEFGDTLRERLLGIMQSDAEAKAGDHNAELVNTLYQAFMDWDARDAAGTTPLMPYLQEIEDIQNLEDLTAYIEDPGYKLAGILDTYVGQSTKDSGVHVLLIGIPEKFLNDAADYDDLENMSDYTKLIYDCGEEEVETVLTQCGYTEDEAKQIYEGAIQFEKKAAALAYTSDELNLTETQDILNEQIYAPEDLEKYGWYSILKEGLKAQGAEEIPDIWLCEKMDYFEHLDELLSDDNVEIIKDYLLAHTASEAIDRLDRATYYKYQDIQNKMDGSEGYREETTYAVNVVSGELQWPLSRLYCDQYVSAEDKQVIYDLIEEILDAYKDMLQEEDFLSEATKEKAIEKLSKIRINCMYPDDWSKYCYDDLEISDSYFEALADIEEYEAQKQFAKINEPVDQDKWTDNPLAENAYYDFQNNSINIMPGLIGDNFYNSDMSKEEIYGKTGAVIGHEISHAFDSNGSAYDADGNHVDWWTSEDKAKFKEKTDRLVAYFDSISAWDGVFCNGEMVKTEACADMGGISVLLRLAAKDPDFDYQTFFKSYARSWAENDTPELTYNCVKYDVHPLSYLRVNTVVAQYQEFLDAFDVKEGDGMYIAPEDRVTIW